MAATYSIPREALDATKPCSKCKVVKPFDDYCADASKKDGCSSSCRDCMRAWRNANPEKMRAAAKKWQAANPEAVKLNRLAFYWKDPEKRRADTLAKYHSQKNKYRAFAAASYQRNKDVRLKESKRWHAENRERSRQIKRAWKERNPEYLRADRARRRCLEAKSCPAWADRVALRQPYEEARALFLLTGQKYHVDHIIPIRHKLVCGLHVPWNLQVLPAKENMQKTNSWSFT